MAQASFDIKSKISQATFFSLAPTALLLIILAFSGSRDLGNIYLLQNNINRLYFVIVFLQVFCGVFAVIKTDKYVIILISLIGIIPIFIYLSFAFSDYGIPLGVRLSAKGEPEATVFTIVLTAIYITIANYISFFAFALSFGIRARAKGKLRMTPPNEKD